MNSSKHRPLILTLSQRALSLFPHRWVGFVQGSLDFVGWSVALAAASYLRLDFSFDGVRTGGFLFLLVLVGFVEVGFGLLMGLYRQRWQFGSLDEAGAVVRTTLCTTVTMFVVNDVINPQIVPRSSVIAAGFLGAVAMFAIRYVWRIVFQFGRQPTDQASRTIVFGAGVAGAEIVRSLKLNPRSPLLPVAVLDDDPSKQRQEVAHVRVLGNRHALADVATRLGAKTLLIAMPSATKDLITELNRTASSLGLDVKILPAVGELFGEEPTVSDIRNISETDLLGRRQIQTDVSSIAGYLRGQRVLVTGAGGSIGSELCRQIARYEPEALLMLDRDESALHSVQMSIEGRALLDSPNLILADIRDRDHMFWIFEEYAPQVVFHAAALKHLSLLETHPAEAVKSNVWGTRNVLDAAMHVGVAQFVNISTDKAANPSSVLGYSKRIAERLTARCAQIAETGTYLSVRFGNVLGSRGSVLPAFRSMIAAGGPVTVTDPMVTRFFMTIPESVELVIQAGAIGGPGEVLILDMGSPIRIDDVARMLIHESGRDIAIDYTGLRPGEKLHEELFGDGEVDVRPVHPLISHAPVPPIDLDQVFDFDVLDVPERVVKRLQECSAVERRALVRKAG